MQVAAVVNAESRSALPAHHSAPSIAVRRNLNGLVGRSAGRLAQACA